MPCAYPWIHACDDRAAIIPRWPQRVFQTFQRTLAALRCGSNPATRYEEVAAKRRHPLCLLCEGILKRPSTTRLSGAAPLSSDYCPIPYHEEIRPFGRRQTAGCPRDSRVVRTWGKCKTARRKVRRRPINGDFGYRGMKAARRVKCDWSVVPSGGTLEIGSRPGRDVLNRRSLIVIAAATSHLNICPSYWYVEGSSAVAC
jgi:hypothetical protein